MRCLTRSFVLAVALLALAAPAFAAHFVWTNRDSITAFESTADVFTFDSLTSVYPVGGAGFNGTPVAPSAQITDQYSPRGVLIGSNGGPAAVINVSVCCRGDALTLPNMLAGTSSLGSGPLVNYYSPIYVTCVVPNTTQPRPVDRIGGWNDVTGSRIRLTAFDEFGAPIDSVEADQGSYLAIVAPGICSARFVYLYTESIAGWTLDNLAVGVRPVLGVAPAEVQSALRLAAPRPNPARGGAFDVALSLPRSGGAVLTLVDVAGREIARRDLGELAAGERAIHWDTGVRAPGLYFVRATGPGGTTVSRPWVLLR